MKETYIGPIKELAGVVETQAKKIEALELAVQQLHQVYMVNLQAVKQGFQINDTHVTVSQMVLQDLAAPAGHVHRWPLHPEVLEFYRERYEKAYELVGEDIKPSDWFRHWRDVNPTTAEPVMEGQTIDWDVYHGEYTLMNMALLFFKHLKQLLAPPEEQKDEETDGQAPQGDPDDEGRPRDLAEDGGGRDAEDPLPEVQGDSSASAVV